MNGTTQEGRQWNGINFSDSLFLDSLRSGRQQHHGSTFHPQRDIRGKCKLALSIIQLGLTGVYWQSMSVAISQTSDSWPTWLNELQVSFPDPLNGPMRHFCLASHFSSTVGKYKTTPWKMIYFKFICFLVSVTSPQRACMTGWQDGKEVSSKGIDFQIIKAKHVCFIKWGGCWGKKGAAG